MKKMKLSLDDLKVESFQTTPDAGEGEKGTVFGYLTQDLTICDTCDTCNASCNGTCNASCGGTCGNTCNGTCHASCGGTCDASCNGGCGGVTCPEMCGTFACFYCTNLDC